MSIRLSLVRLRGGVQVTEEDKVGTELYFIVDGEVEVIQNDERLGFLGVGSFFGAILVPVPSLFSVLNSTYIRIDGAQCVVQYSPLCRVLC